MVEATTSDDLLNVPVEATAFLAAVSAFAVFLLVIFAYANKKWRLLNVGSASVQKEISQQQQQQQQSKAQYKSHLGETYKLCKSPSSGSDSEDDILQRLSMRHHHAPQQQQQQHHHPLLAHQSHSLDSSSYNPHHAPPPSQHSHGGYHPGGHYGMSLLMRQTSFDVGEDELELNQHLPLQQQQTPSHPQGQQQQQQEGHQQHSHHAPPLQYASYHHSLMDSSCTTILPSAVTCTPLSRRSDSVSSSGNQSTISASQSPALMHHPSSSSNQQTGPSTSSHYVHNSQQHIRPLRVSSIRDIDDVVCSRRRPHPRRLIRSNTGPAGSGGGGSDGSDLMSLAEKGKVNGGSSASSTSSNASADDDLHHHHHHLSHHHHHSHSHHHHNHHHQLQSTLSHPHPISVRQHSRDPIQRIQQPSTGGSTGSGRRMMLPPRTKSVDSESPPPSEQGLSTNGDSIADQDDHIFEVEEMSLVEGELGLTLESGRVNSSPVQCGSLEVAFDYEAAARKLTVHIIQARGIPPKDIGGASNTQVRLVLLPSRKQKHKTKVRPGENPQFVESFVFTKINPEDVSSVEMRFRLYGCERMRRERLLGECILSFGSIHLELETTLWLNLEARYHLTWDSRSESGSIARSDSASSTASIQSGIPELLVGLAYNGTTGRLTVEIIKGSHFRNLAGGRAPDSYVKLVLVGCNGQEMGRVKSSLRRAQSNPLFKETFMFQVALFQISEVTLLVSVYGRKGVTRRELLGWFALGYNSSGDEETTHWEDMIDAHGDQMCRWHVLLQS